MSDGTKVLSRESLFTQLRNINKREKGKSERILAFKKAIANGDMVIPDKLNKFEIKNLDAIGIKG